MSGYGFQLDSCPPEQPDLLISTSDVWDVPAIYNRNIKIKSGITLEIKTKISMGEGKYIEVERGAKLIVNGGHLTNCDDDYWQGIYVHGNASIEQPDPTSDQPADLNEAGIVLIKNSSIIEYAVAGVHTFGRSIPPAQRPKYHGGVIYVENSRFLNNIVGVRFEDYHFDNNVNNMNFNKSNFSSTLFEQNADKLDFQRKYGASIQGCEGIGFDHCQFNDLFAGVFGINFGAFIIDGNKFIENSYGIIRISFLPIFNRLVVGDKVGLEEDNEFSNNGTGILMIGDTGPIQASISNNQFSCGRFGVDVQNGGDCFLKENVFTDVPFSIRGVNSGNINAKCNTINNENTNIASPVGITFVGNCQNSQFVGNKFKKTRVNVRISEYFGEPLNEEDNIPGQVNGLQGIPLTDRTADNVFGPNAGRRIDINGNTVPFTYYVPNDPSTPSNYYPESNPNAYTIVLWSSDRDICFDTFIGDEPEEELENIRDLVIDAEANLLANPDSEYWRVQHLSLLNSRESLKNNLIRKYLEEGNYTAAENILIGENPALEKRWLYGVSVKKGDIEEAKNRLELIGTNNMEDLFFTQTQEIYLETLESLVPFVLTDDQKSILENIISTENNSKGIAESLLMIYDAENHQLSEIECSECGCSANLNEKEESFEDKIVSPIEIYPNPATDLININLAELEQNTFIKVEMYDSRGVLTMAKSFPENSSKLMVNTVDFNTGLYFLRIYQEGKLIFTDKLILMK